MPSVIGLPYNNCPCLYVKGAIDLMNPEDKGIYSETNAGITQFLKSTANTKGFKQVDLKGKLANPLEKGAVYAEYYPQDCTPITDPALAYCTWPTSSNAHVGKKTVKHYTDIRVTWSFTINNESTRDKCFGYEEIQKDLIQANKGRVLKDIETKIQASIESTIGGYKNQISPITSCTNPLLLNVINDKTNMLNPSVFGQMKMQFAKKKINRPIHYFADESSFLTMALANQPQASFNSFGGYDLSKVNPLFSVSDDLSTNLSTCAVGDKILALPEYTYQLIQWNAFVGEYEVPFNQRGFFEKTTMDLWGIKWDVFMNRSVCDDVFVFEANLGVISTIPSDMACNDQNALLFLAGCGENDCATNVDCQEA